MCLLTSGHVKNRRLRICIQIDTVDLLTYLNVYIDIQFLLLLCSI